MYDVGALDRGPVRLPWVVLELLSGPTFEQEISQRRRQGRHWSARELSGIFEPILDGLAYAHGRGIMHRDVKPSNIILSSAPSGALEPKLLDFGTARTQLSVFQTSLGKTGFTPLYGAPEQWDPNIAPPTPATDVYALGLTLLESATLQRPHGAADSLPAIMRAVMGGAGVASLGEVRPDLPVALAAVIERALAVQPGQRFRDANELRAAVRAALATTSPGALTVPPPFAMAPFAMAQLAPSAAPPAAQAVPAAPFRTTSPFVATPQIAPAAPSSSGLGIIAIALAGLALVVVLGAVGLGGFFYFVRAPTGPTAQPAGGSAQPRGPAPPVLAAKPISPPNVRGSEEFDLKNAVLVAQKNQPAMEACAARSHRFNGAIDVVLDVSSRDGRVVGTDCHTVWPSYDKKHPKLDPEAAELCACIQTVTPSWTFKPPKPEVAMPLFDDTVWLHVQYVCALEGPANTQDRDAAEGPALCHHSDRMHERFSSSLRVTIAAQRIRTRSPEGDIMASDKKNEVLTTYVTDVHALVTHGLQAVHRQVENLKNVSHQDARKAVAAFETILKKQKDDLEARIEALGGSKTQPVKDAVSAVAGVAAGLINAVRPSETAKSIRDDHTYFSHLGIAWLMLHTTASSLGDTATASLAERGYADTARMIMHVDKILPKIVVEELREDKALHPADIENQTRSMVRAAWNREAPTGI